MYVLTGPAGTAAAPPDLDASQRAVVEHTGGPLLVLAGPGTGKTTTLVELVVDRVDRRSVAPDRVLVLTFSREAASELRTRISARLGRTTAPPTTSTFHSFCYALVRELQDPEAYVEPLRLLSAPEQDIRIRDLLAGSTAAGRVDWPISLRPALRTRGFAAELQTMMARARFRRLDPEDLALIAWQAGRPDWQAVAEFFGEYLEVLDAQHEVDYAELVHRALLIASDPWRGARLRGRYDLVVVDEYQDTDPAQVALLKALAGGGRNLVAVGDPDQSIYAFRGADAGGILRFPQAFATDAGPAPTLALTSTRRYGPAILAATRAVIERAGVPGRLPAETFEAFRNPVPVATAHGDGEVVVQTFRTPAAEAENIALLLRRAHLDDEVPWGQMAVLVRSGTASIPRLQRALVAAGVPVEVAGDEVPLRSEPSVAPLLDALRLAQALAAGNEVDDSLVQCFLTGPLAELDAAGVRRLARALRRRDLADAGDVMPVARSSAVLLAEALVEPTLIALSGDALGPRVLRAAESAATLMARAVQSLAERQPPEEVLWGLWDGSRWGRRLRAGVDAGGDAARTAHRDLDAVCALFELAARSEERHRGRGMADFVAELSGQEIPAETLAERGVRGDAVRLLTAHRSKGREWRLVVVAGVQETSWPDVRYRGTLLQSDRLSRDGVAPRATASALLGEERRLFYVATTRARQRLVVTAVHSPAEDGDQPSRFLTELRPFATVPPVPPLGRPTRPLSLRGVVGELRCLAETSDEPAVRAAAATRLARLASTGLAPAAHPDSWWGVREVTASQVPVRTPDEPLALSGSSLAGLVACPLSWFLSHEAKGETPSTTAQGFGLLVHALAADVVRGGSSADVGALTERLDTVWRHLGFSAPWVSVRERHEAVRALERFVHWHRASTRTPLAAEHEFVVALPVGGDTVVLRGSMDRVEVDAGGRVHVVDFKTGKSKPSVAELSTHPQLGVYQVAVEQGAVDDLVDPPAVAGGAQLVHLRQADKRTPDVPRTQAQAAPTPDESFLAYEQLTRASVVVRGEEFAATPSPTACGYCSFKAVCPAQPEGGTIVPFAEEAHR